MLQNDVAVLVELDYCVGCSACQAACQDYNRLSIEETYLRNVLLKPDEVDGELVDFMSPVPYALHHCKDCLDAEGVAPCTKICVSRALHIDTPDAILAYAKECPSRVAVFM